MARRVIGLDLGAYSVKLVRLETGKQTPKFEVQDVVEEILPNDEADDRDLLEKQKEAVLNLQRRGLLEAETFAIGLSALDGQMRTMRVPFLESRKIEAVLPGLLEAEVPYEIDAMTISWHRLEEARSESGGEKPDGATIRLAFGKKLAIARTLQMLQTLPVDPRQMHLSSVALYEIVRELGFGPFASLLSADQAEVNAKTHSLGAIVDFGHQATSICIFDAFGLKLSRSFLRAGKKLTEEIAKALEIPFSEAEKLKHEKLDLMGYSGDEQTKQINEIALNHYHELCDEITRTFIAMKTSGLGEVRSVALVGGGALARGLQAFFSEAVKGRGISIVSLSDVVPEKVSSPTMALSLAYALSCLQVHAKESRFNFRKDEFAWRGDLDFLRTKSTPLILWGLVLICSLTILWSASSLVLEKESAYLEHRLKAACSQILGQKNVASKKCLALMKEQISANVDLGVPDFTASDVYLKIAEFLPKDLNITVDELDVSEKKVRISASTASFEDVDKIAANLSKIPCFVSVEKGSAKQTGNLVKVTLSSDLDCHATSAQQKPKQ